MTVYAIGGASSGGKTTVSTALGSLPDYEQVIHLDDVRSEGNRTGNLQEQPGHSWYLPQKNSSSGC